jgi:hypothetical protein
MRTSVRTLTHPYQPVRFACIVIHWFVRALENMSHRSSISLSCLPISTFCLSRASSATPYLPLSVRCRRDAAAQWPQRVASAWTGHDAEAWAALDIVAHRHQWPRSWEDQRGRPGMSAPSPSRVGAASLPRRVASAGEPPPTSVSA